MFKFDDILETDLLFSRTTPLEISNIAPCEHLLLTQQRTVYIIVQFFLLN